MRFLLFSTTVWVGVSALGVAQTASATRATRLEERLEQGDFPKEARRVEHLLLFGFAEQDVVAVREKCGDSGLVRSGRVFAGQLVGDSALVEFSFNEELKVLAVHRVLGSSDSIVVVLELPESRGARTTLTSDGRPARLQLMSYLDPVVVHDGAARPGLDWSREACRLFKCDR